MTEQITQTKWVVAGIYNWEAITTKEVRILGNYPRHNWCDIDVFDMNMYESVLAVYKKYQVDVISQRVGRGWHIFGDVVSYELWRKIWFEIKPYADPRWAPHTLRVSKKYDTEIFERPIYHKNKNEPPNWSKALMSYLCKSIRDENSTNLLSSMHKVGLDKYFQCTVYKVKL